MTDLVTAVNLVAEAKKLVVLTGAGMSAESGVPTFRDAQVGLWENFDPTQLATPEAFEQDPELVWSWYMWRAQLVRGVAPHDGHRAITTAQVHRGTDATAETWTYVATQNVDDLHERAGTQVGSHLHGDLFAYRCIDCARPATVDVDALGEMTPDTRVPVQRCTHCDGLIRPGVVWFGEALPEEGFRTTIQKVQEAEVIVVVGSSGMVQPAASLPLLGQDEGAKVIEVNPQPTELSRVAEVYIQATAEQVLPQILGTAPRFS